MTNLTHTQSILLSTASQRESGSLLPLPETLTNASAALLKRGLAGERDTMEADAVHRSDGDLRYGVFVTSAGLAAIGAGAGPAPATLPEPPAAKPERRTKSAAVIALLQREGAQRCPN